MDYLKEFTDENARRLENLWEHQKNGTQPDNLRQDYIACLKTMASLQNSGKKEAWAEEMTVANEYSKFFPKSECFAIAREAGIM